MSKPSKPFVNEKILDEHLKNDQYKYSILLNLRDHEHTVLWQKFNVFLGFNTIIIAVIAAIITLQRDINPSSSSSFLFDLKPDLLILFVAIFFMAYLCSIFISRILKGSDFWIDVWERKLYVSECAISTDTNTRLSIFSDHASRLKQELAIVIEKIKSSQSKEEIDLLKIRKDEIQEILKDATNRGYISTRHNMVLLIGAIKWLWALLFSAASAITICTLMNRLYDLGALLILILYFLEVACVIQWIIDTYSKNEIDNLLKK